MPSHTRASIYDIFYLYIEPIATTALAYLTFADPVSWLQTNPNPTVGASFSTSSLTAATDMLFDSLSNMFLTLTVISVLVLRVSDDYKVWCAMTWGYLASDFKLIYDFGKRAGWETLYDVKNWNAGQAGTLGLIYTFVILRFMFLAGVGVKIHGSNAVRTKKTV